MRPLYLGATMALGVAIAACDSGSVVKPGAENTAGNAVSPAAAAAAPSSVPGTVGDLRVVATTDSSITVAFTQVDDGTGKPASYDIRSAVAPISWGSASSVANGTCKSPLAGTKVGDTMTCSIGGLTKSTSYNVQLVSYRGTLNVNAVFGPLSKVVAANTASSAPAPAPVATVGVTLAASNLTIGQTAQASATAYDAAGNVLTGRAVAWSSSNSAVATVSASGVVTSIAAGTATITATSEGKAGSANVTVAPAPVAKVGVSLAASNVAIGQTTQASATAYDAADNALTGRAVAWSSSNSAVATVSNSGVVTAVAAGTASITATSEGKSGSATVTVPAPVLVAPGSVADLRVVSTTDSSITVAFTQVDDGSGKPASYDIRNSVAPISWGSASSVTSGSCKSPVAGTKIGDTITCTISGLTAATSYNAQSVAFRGTLNVNAVFGSLSKVVAANTTASAPAPVATVGVSLASSSVTVGQTTQASATTYSAAGAALTGRVVAWSSSNSAIATVSSSGVVTAIAAGTATITATSEGKAGSATITVKAPAPAPVATVSVSIASGSLTVGQTTQATATTRDASNNVLTGRAVTWSSSNAAVASVSASGMVTAVGAGSATITATSEGKAGSASVSVQASAPPPPPPPGGTNEPAGATVISQRPFNTIQEAGWSQVYAAGGSVSYSSIVADPTAPSGPTVGQIRFPAGFPGGDSPCRQLLTINSTATTLYVGYWVKPSANWVNHSTNINKLFYVVINGGDVLYLSLMGTDGSGGAPLRAAASIQSAVSGNGNLISTGVVARGQWTFVEYVITLNTSGQANGRFTTFVNGTQVGNWTGIQYTSGAGSFTGMKIDPVWGGIGGSIGAEQLMSFDDLRISGK